MDHGGDGDYGGSIPWTLGWVTLEELVLSGFWLSPHDVRKTSVILENGAQFRRIPGKSNLELLRSDTGLRYTICNHQLEESERVVG